MSYVEFLIWLFAGSSALAIALSTAALVCLIVYNETVITGDAES